MRRELLETVADVQNPHYKLGWGLGIRAQSQSRMSDEDIVSSVLRRAQFENVEVPMPPTAAFVLGAIEGACAEEEVQFTAILGHQNIGSTL